MADAAPIGPPSGGEGRRYRRFSNAVGELLLLAAILIQILSGPDEGPPWRRLWFDTLQQVMPRERVATPAVVVEIDNESLGQIGQWPWPRHYLAELIRLVDAAGARAIGLDIILSEPDRLSPEVIVNWIGLEDPAAVAAIRALGDTDVALAEAIRRSPVALASAGVRAAGSAPEHPSLGPRVILEEVEADDLLSFDHGIGPIELLRPVAGGFGAISYEPNRDNVLRRAPLVQRIAGRPYILLGPEAQRIADEADVARVRPQALGLAVDLGRVTAPAETNGDFWLHVGRFDRSRYVSAVDLVAGEPSAIEAIGGKIALIAVTGLGAVDLQLTPLREEVYGVEAHLQVLEQIAEGRFLRRPTIIFYAEIAVTAAFGFLIIVLIRRVRPQLGLPALLASGATLGGLSMIAFQNGLLVDAASPVLAGGLIGMAVTGLTLIERDRERLLAEIALARSREAAARIETELAAAGEIQRSLLPAESHRVDGLLDLACHIQPARHVGGDFYDHFMIDARRLFFVVGDVSGKGIEASVFMGLSKALWKSIALRPDLPLDRLQAITNAEIARDNPNMMFVTGIAGILDLETGALDFSSAGHEAPFIFGPDGPPRRLPEFTGPPVGLAADAEYPVGKDRLAPGEGICLFSDGVSEAENPGRELYGVQRLENRLATAPAGASAREVVDLIRDDVANFADGAAPSDDLTVMVVIRPRARQGS